MRAFIVKVFLSKKIETKVLIIGGAIFGITLFALLFIFPKSTEKAPVQLLSSADSSSTSKTTLKKSSSSEPEKRIFYVDVKGAVLTAQVIKIHEGEIVQSAINQAGGANSEADMTKLNLAAEVTAGQVIYVPKKGEDIPTQFSTTNTNSTVSSTGNTNSEKAKIDLNTADTAALQTITGVGIKKAEEILKYRDEHGKFKSVEDLKKISGFGQKTVEKLLDYVCAN
ncbi:hypothetical protein EVC35_01645 [Oenococcus sicerae]|uniref:Helix-hairpin-helix DNA-binding motif class 1 domain-containing protein n=1 Tax=Oenococcus sicerae TaxID=2203724 RepID=A0AAJ1R8X6_9LACO|nr:hypothetical protein [Oenococcus sicerae]